MLVTLINGLSNKDTIRRQASNYYDKNIKKKKTNSYINKFYDSGM